MRLDGARGWATIVTGASLLAMDERFSLLAGNP